MRASFPLAPFEARDNRIAVTPSDGQWHRAAISQRFHRNPDSPCLRANHVCGDTPAAPPRCTIGLIAPEKETTMGTNRLPWILTGLFLTGVSVGNAQTPPPPGATEGILTLRCREFVFPPPTRGEALSPAACRTGALPPLASNDCQLIDPAYCSWRGPGLARHSRSSTPVSAVPAPVGPPRNARSSGSEGESALRASRKVGGV